MPIVEHSERGRCYITDQNLKPGEMFLQEDALQTVLISEKASGRCHHTFQEATGGTHLLR